MVAILSVRMKEASQAMESIRKLGRTKVEIDVVGCWGEAKHAASSRLLWLTVPDPRLAKNSVRGLAVGIMLAKLVEGATRSRRSESRSRNRKQ